MARSQLALGWALALLIGALGGCGREPTTDEAQTSRETGSTDCTRTPPDTTPVPVVVIQEPISAGTTAEDAISGGALIETSIGWGLRPSTAAASFDQLASGTAVDDLAANQVATLNQWGLPTDVTLPGSPQADCPG